MASSKRWKFKKILTGNGGCGCGKQKASDIYDPKSNSKTSSNSWVSEEINDKKLMHDRRISKMDSLAIVKDSEDPYEDFGRSMLEMILEREIYSADDLQELLTCFLQLNSPHHHQIILQAFTDIWNISLDPAAAALQPHMARAKAVSRH
ncbi:transcription repressor OFP6-like [Forsythia ovata]|uniref:Transcription repressor n=1 Tax=Forsythia ovata TaxID=205694 RepID=A0ABD1T2Q3_9LAMI